MAERAQTVPKIRLGLSQTQLKSQSRSTSPQTHLGLSQTHLKSSQKIPKSHKKIQMTSKSTPNLPKSSKDTSNPKTRFSIHPRNPRKFPEFPYRCRGSRGSRPLPPLAAPPLVAAEIWICGMGGKSQILEGKSQIQGAETSRGSRNPWELFLGPPNAQETPKSTGIPQFWDSQGRSQLRRAIQALQPFGIPLFGGSKSPKKSRNPRGFPHSGSSAEPLGRSRPSIPNF